MILQYLSKHIIALKLHVNLKFCWHPESVQGGYFCGVTFSQFYINEFNHMSQLCIVIGKVQPTKTTFTARFTTLRVLKSRFDKNSKYSEKKTPANITVCTVCCGISQNDHQVVVVVSALQDLIPGCHVWTVEVYVRKTNKTWVVCCWHSWKMSQCQVCVTYHNMSWKVIHQVHCPGCKRGTIVAKLRFCHETSHCVWCDIWR